MMTMSKKQDEVVQQVTRLKAWPKPILSRVRPEADAPGEKPKPVKAKK